MRFSLPETGLALCKKEIYISLGTLRGRFRTSLPCQIPLSEKSIIFAPSCQLKHGVDVHSPYLRGRNSGVEFSVWVRGSLSVFRIRIRENTNFHFDTTFTEMEPASAPSARKSIRPHRKSRAGCSTCKRRKVKVSREIFSYLARAHRRQCNEEKPCSNCISFGLPCNLVLDSDCLQYAGPPVARRGRGRPRNTWTGEWLRLIPCLFLCHL